MEPPTLSSPRFRFGGFELDPRSGELVRNGEKVRLHEQPLQLLLALLERPGELVTREELTARLWSAGTFVDFERGLNKAVNKLREVLGDSADSPRFIETLPRKGYRFVAELEAESAVTEEPFTDTATAPRPRKAQTWYTVLAAGVCVMALAAIVVGKWRSTWPSKSSAPLQIASLAVLPLENLSGDSEQAYFADGMTDALITEIARAGSMRVISRTTMLRYKATRMSTQQIGRELNVDALVEGTILRSGDRVRITAQLIQVSTDNHLWAQSYQRDATQILQLQQDVASDIARQVGHVVKPVEPLRTIDPGAYGEYLKGRFYFFQYTPEGWQKAIEHYNNAIKADPSFAPAYSGLAESYVVAWAWNAFPSQDGLLGKAEAAARKALQLDPALASAHLALGEVYDQEWQHARGGEELRRAVELNPNDPLAWQLHGTHWLFRGDFQTGIAEQERARSLDPFSPIINANLARAFCYARQFDQAISQAIETLKLEPGYPVALTWLAHAYRHKGMFEKALAAHLAAASPEDSSAIERAYRSAGYSAVQRYLGEAEKRNGNHLKAAAALAQAGDREQAVSLLLECYRIHCPGLGRLGVEPDFDPIRSDPRFQTIVQGTGHWEEESRYR
jgi:TolB-like protein/DNA-binding winged helix-turn-helix (wHTH) protein